MKIEELAKVIELRRENLDVYFRSEPNSPYLGNDKFVVPSIGLKLIHT
jgi:hypothetical protein